MQSTTFDLSFLYETVNHQGGGPNCALYHRWLANFEVMFHTHFFKNSPTAFTTAAWSTSFTVTPGI